MSSYITFDVEEYEQNLYDMTKKSRKLKEELETALDRIVFLDKYILELLQKIDKLENRKN